eukprot:79056_1
MSTSQKVLLSKSLLDLRQILDKELASKYAKKNLEDIQEESKANEGNKTPEVTTPTSTSHISTAYKLPLTFNYHQHQFIFHSDVSENMLRQFHSELEKHKTSIFERYGWRPSLQQRVDIYLNTSLSGFIINKQNNDIMAMITLFDVSDSSEKIYEFEKELSLCVLPQYQRRHIATDLVRLTWNLFAHPTDECWVYVMNSNKSGMFWRKFKQWYPAVNFRLVRP